MKTSVFVEPARLFTTWGTVFYISDRGELLHGDADAVPANLFLQRMDDGQTVKLIAAMNGSNSLLTFKANGGAFADSSSDEVGTTLAIISLERGLFGLRAGETFLSAEPDGRVTASRSRCSVWEYFLASEMWCGHRNKSDAVSLVSEVDRYALERYLINPLTRIKTNISSGRPRILIYGYPFWSHGRVYYDIMNRYWQTGIIIDIVNWQEDHSTKFAALQEYYSLILTAPDGVRTLIDSYQVPPSRMIVVSHHEYDIKMLVEAKGKEIFDQFAAYGVVSYYVYCASLMQGIQRQAIVVPLGVDFANFFEPVSPGLRVVGYASSMSVVTFGVEWKRGHLAEEAAALAGLEFKIAGNTAHQISFHDMPQFYKTIDCVLTSSVSEAAQIPCMEGAAAGRLVIGTPVGHFPLRAYQGGGIIAPIEERKFVAFVSETLKFYQHNPQMYQETCKKIQESARQFDWQNCFSSWLDIVDLAESSLQHLIK